MSTTLLKPKTTLAVYAILLKRVRQAIAAGKDRAAVAVERELVRTKWETGKLILEHILLNKDRADYGEKVIVRLSKDLNASQSELEYMLQFARANPIAPAPGQLSWANQRELLSVNNDSERTNLAKLARKEKWTSRTTRKEIKKLRAAKQITVTKGPAPVVLKAKRGTSGIYRVVDWKGRKAYDLGFSTYYVLKGTPPRAQEPSVDELFTYEAEIDAVFDADTLWADIHLGFGIWTHQKLRLRGIDAPEIITTEGQAAKRYLQKLLKNSQVLITSTKSDKYDRYLADIWVGDTFINQVMLDKGYAVAVFE